MMLVEMLRMRSPDILEGSRFRMTTRTKEQSQESTCKDKQNPLSITLLKRPVSF